MPTFTSTITRSYQYELGGLLMGSGSNYIMEEVDGLLSLPDLKSNDVEYQNRHGGFVGADFMKMRSVKMKIAIDGTSQSDVETKVDLVQQITHPSAILMPLLFRRPNYTHDRIVWVRPRKRSLLSNSDLGAGLGRIAVELLAPDPRIYENRTQTVSGLLASGGSSVTLNVTPLGEFHTPPVITMTGPATNPRISNDADGGKTIKLDVVLDAIDTLVLDVSSRTVTISGSDRYEVVRSDNEWWEIQPGVVNHITFDRSGTTGDANVEIDWQDAWI